MAHYCTFPIGNMTFEFGLGFIDMFFYIRSRSRVFISYFVFP